MSAPDDLVPGPHESLDLLAGSWRIFQLKRGHRFSTDDLVTAWRAAENAPDAVRLLDIGCGLGSVGLTTLYRLEKRSGPPRTLVGVEAQQESAAMAKRTVRVNGLSDRVAIHHGDLRDSGVLPEDAKFDLITGSPPYIPLGKGLLSPVPQRAACRIELRGSVYDYCEAARRWLAPGGRFCFVMVAADPRTEDAPVQSGLAVLERYDIYFRDGRDPLICTMVCGHAEEFPEVERRTGRLVVRDLAGEWTPEYYRFRAEMGFEFEGRS
jgi:tRNA1Val (adenine37-N6)-methyltransferase